MTTNYKNCSGRLWLTSFLATVGVWTYFDSCAFAQSAGTITVNTGNLIIRDDTSIRVSPEPVLIAGSSTNENGGEIRLEASQLILTNRPRAIPEPSSTLGLLAFAVFGAASVLKCKQKNRQLHINFVIEPIIDRYGPA